MPQGLACRPSCVHVTTSQNSSSVPNPPGSATKASDRSAIQALRSCIEWTTCSFVSPSLPDLPCQKVFRHDSLHVAARPHHGICNHTHQTHIAAADHQPDL